MSDHGEHKARVVPLEIRPMRIYERPADPLGELQQLLAGAADSAAIVVTHVTAAVIDPSVTLQARDLKPLVAEEIDRAAAAAADIYDRMQLEDVEIQRDHARDRVDALEAALLPFAEAGKRFCITTGGTIRDTLSTIGHSELRAAYDAMCGRGV